MAPNSPIPESRILKPLDPTLSNEDDWPDFLLTAAEVSDPDTGELQSLLLAGPSKPLTLTGKLSKSKDQLQYLIQSNLAQALPAIISVPHVEHFCYGQDNDGQAVLWAAGHAGWFRIQPSRTYKAIHKHSCEAVNVLYFLADLYADLKGRKQKSTPVETVFKQYVEDDSNRCSDESKAEQVFLNHRLFLIDCMAKGKEGINWKNTSIYDFLLQDTDDEASTSAMDFESDSRTPRPKDTSDEEPSHRRFGKTKSSLRPRSSLYSLKAMGRRSDIDGVGPPAALIEDFQSPLKRKTTAGGRFRPRKRTTPLDEGQDALMHSHFESDSSEDMANELPLPLQAVPRQKTAATGKAQRIKIIESPLPSYQPQGPGDTWSCTFDGCSYVVYDAERPENQALVKDHYAQHAIESQTQIDLICQEERPYLPVNNLIKRIRDLAGNSRFSDNHEEDVAPATSDSPDSGLLKSIRKKWP